MSSSDPGSPNNKPNGNRASMSRLSPLAADLNGTGNDPWASNAATKDEHFAKKSAYQKLIGTWLHPFTRFHRIPVARRVWLYLFLMAGYTVLVDWYASTTFPSRVFKEAGSMAFGGVILGLLLVFRTNSAYERWWEGRKLWGQLVNDTRNLCLKIRAFVPVDQAEKIQFGELLVSFAYALKHHLRETTPSRPLPGIGVLSETDVQHIPVLAASKVFDKIEEWYHTGRIDGYTLLQLDMHAKALMDICGSCERIKGSPLAVSYRAFMRQGIALNLIALPWYLTPEFSIWWALPLILVGAYFLIGLELIAEDIEDPFGYDGDDLPLDNICANVKKTVSDILQVKVEQKYTRSFDIPRIDPLKSGH
jgi:putative membrane protein